MLLLIFLLIPLIETVKITTEENMKCSKYDNWWYSIRILEDDPLVDDEVFNTGIVYVYKSHENQEKRVFWITGDDGWLGGWYFEIRAVITHNCTNHRNPESFEHFVDDLHIRTEEVSYLFKFNLDQ
ncbi:unnamed protein product [Caenorhabditis angaria]|uniref:Uncharacterized protein n=1 Tax=Caenorhabditis angaria TaxID=860376 RepID=A0A9P1I6R4_9PELO|nr:unnamed protein product [Caenorhabditis angaria]